MSASLKSISDAARAFLARLNIRRMPAESIFLGTVDARASMIATLSRTSTGGVDCQKVLVWGATNEYAGNGSSAMRVSI